MLKTCGTNPSCKKTEVSGEPEFLETLQNFRVSGQTPVSLRHGSGWGITDSGLISIWVSLYIYLRIGRRRALVGTLGSSRQASVRPIV